MRKPYKVDTPEKWLHIRYFGMPTEMCIRDRLQVANQLIKGYAMNSGSPAIIGV